MSGWKARRFWSDAQAVPAEGGFAVHLDDRPLRTPARRPVVVPTAALASALAAEWQAQEAEIDAQTMPLTRMVNSAIDTVADNRAHVIDTIAAYGDSDLLCYRAAHPEALVQRQSAEWDPLLDWAAQALGASLTVTQGVMHQPQSPAALVALRAPLEAASALELVALHEWVTLSGSLVIGLRLGAGDGAEAADLWRVSRLDERWQAEVWGSDDDAEQLAATRGAAFEMAARLYRLMRD